MKLIRVAEGLQMKLSDTSRPADKLLRRRITGVSVAGHLRNERRKSPDYEDDPGRTDAVSAGLQVHLKCRPQHQRTALPATGRGGEIAPVLRTRA